MFNGLLKRCYKPSVTLATISFNCHTECHYAVIEWRGTWVDLVKYSFTYAPLCLYFYIWLVFYNCNWLFKHHTSFVPT